MRLPAQPGTARLRRSVSQRSHNDVACGRFIVQASEDNTPLGGEIEVGESYFGGHRKGKRGRGAAGESSSRAA